MTLTPLILDIEIVLGNISSNELSVIKQQIPSNYIIEDKFENGWGYVLMIDKEFTNTINQSVEEFLKPLEHIVKLIFQHNCLLRIAVYYSTFTCTLKFDLKEYLSKFNLVMEITTYPTE